MGDAADMDMESACEQSGEAAMEKEMAAIPAEIFDPSTGEVVDATDVDALVDAWERMREQESLNRAFRYALATALCALTTDTETKTRRVRGNRRRCVVKMPDDVWEQGRLKEAWFAYPQFRDEFLAIDRIRPRLREVKKLLAEAGPPDFEAFKVLVRAADLGPHGSPSVTVEE